MRFERNPYRELPDGTIAKVFPFHLSLEGLETRILCRDEDDYDSVVKILAVCAKRKNVILVTYAVVSNHAHSVFLAASESGASDFGLEVKRMISMYFCRKYHDKAVMAGIDSKAIFIDSDWYLRNAIAYDIRNAMDNGEGIQTYKWTGYRALFRKGRLPDGGTPVRSLSKRDKRTLLRTDDDLSGVGWVLNSDKELEPVTICDWRYAEASFNDDQAFFMKVLGCTNTAEMDQKLVVAPRIRQKDDELLRNINDICQRWFKKEAHDLPIEKKLRVLPYVFRSCRTSTAQLARAFELERAVVEKVIGRQSCD